MMLITILFTKGKFKRYVLILMPTITKLLFLGLYRLSGDIVGELNMKSVIQEL